MRKIIRLMAPYRITHSRDRSVFIKITTSESPGHGLFDHVRLFCMYSSICTIHQLVHIPATLVRTQWYLLCPRLLSFAIFSMRPSSSSFIKLLQTVIGLLLSSFAIWFVLTPPVLGMQANIFSLGRILPAIFAAWYYHFFCFGKNIANIIIKNIF